MKKLVLCFILIFSIIASSFAVPASAASNQLLIINKSINKLAFFENGKLVRVFSVATGRSDDLTPEGTFPVVSKITNRPYYKDNIPGGDPRNPLGDRWLGLDALGTYGTTYAIHGNNNENSIGKYVSSGCIRMHNEEIRWLFPKVNKMTKAVILKSKDSFETIAKKKGYALNEETAKFSAAEQQGKLLLNKTAEYQKAVNTGSISKVNSLYDGLTKQLKAAEAAIGKVPGKSVREGLGSKYLSPAKKTIERSIYEVSQYRLMVQIKGSVQSVNLSKAAGQLKMMDRLKLRAEQIKKAGGYSSLPAAIVTALEKQEAELYGMITKIRTVDYNKSIASSSITSLDRQYNTFTASIAKTEKEIGQVPGPSNRKSIEASYVHPAKVALERTIYQVSMHRQLNKIGALIQAGMKSTAQQELDVFERLQKRSIQIQNALGYPVLKELDRTLTNRYTELKKKLV